MGYSFAIAVMMPAWTAAFIALFLGASWLLAIAILMGTTALGGLGLAALLLSDDEDGSDGLASPAS